MSAFHSRDFAQAHSLFQRAHALQPSARTWRGIGVTAFELHAYTEAREALSHALDEARRPLDVPQRAAVEKSLAWMEQNLATLELEVTPNTASVALSGRSIEARKLSLDPGNYVIEANAPGYRPQAERVTLAALERRRLSLQLEPEVAANRALAPQPYAAEPKPTPQGEAALGPREPAQVSAPTTSEAPTAPPTVLQLRSTNAVARSDRLVEQWWFWTAVGVLAIGGGAAAVALATSQPESRRSDHVDATVTALLFAP